MRSAYLLLALLCVVSCGHAGPPARARPAAPPSAIEPPGPSALPPSPGGQLAFGKAHGCALMGDGTVRCWGENYRGQLGRPPSRTTFALGPEEVPGLHNVVQIAASNNDTCALVADGRVLCWGERAWQEGPGTTNR